MRINDLIFDIGMSEGNDTALYLQKGFRVVGVEADQRMVRKLTQRFENEIAAHKLFIESCAAAATSGARVQFYADIGHQGSSSLTNVHRKNTDELETYEVETINWPTLMSKYGVPYYLKIDIEGAESPFLRSGIEAKLLPSYVSTEIMNFEPISVLHDLGYSKFRIINQLRNSDFPVPTPALEGNLVLEPTRSHWSGFFGKELPGKKWFDFKEIQRIFEMLHELWTYETLTTGWLDCHAWNPNDSD